MSTKIKICGLTRAQDVQTANALQLDYIGFVFTPKSKRFVAPEQAKQLRRQLAPGIRAVGVFDSGAALRTLDAFAAATNG